MPAPRAVLITGGTSGLGLAAARELAARGGVAVTATGRTVTSAPPLPGVAWAALDLADRDSVARIVAGSEPLHALVANAGSQFTGVQRTAAGWEATFAINHLGHVDLICGLLAAGRLAPGARIVIVGSGTHDPAVRTGMPAPRLTTVRAAVDDIGPDADGDGDAERGRGGARAARRRYTTSKLANVMTGLHLARCLAGRGVTVTAFDPGLMPGTGLVRDAPRAVQLLWRTAAQGLRVLPGVTTAAVSGRVLADLAVGDAWAGRTGIYVSLDRVRDASVQARDVAGQERLWAESLALLGIAPDPAAATPAAPSV
ncbi:FabG-like 3-oxoacyl-(acyl-carrier-protein) reductase [Paraconexibacter sp. AEG42_29]|uniref:FabG-like 3-oxoacyl-(Acyl-carrier-protein) reductase n=1 Tax=Paraconexibacter sp. AEG42_29 TaxID=2997339 RepID=A0AAU7AQ00_9ACTN